jgi:putative transcriptional regulator
MPPKPKSLKGHLLLDSGQLGQSWFARTVVLICQHDDDGAFGLVLNRKAPSKMGDVLVADMPEALKEAQLFLGGPVQPSALSYLHTEKFLPDGNVIPNLNLGHALDELVLISDSFSPTSKLRVFAGYSGWGPKQLEGELARKAWLTIPASLDLIFEVPSAELWATVLRRLGGWRNLLLATRPEDPTLN